MCPNHSDFDIIHPVRCEDGKVLLRHRIRSWQEETVRYRKVRLIVEGRTALEDFSLVNITTLYIVVSKGE